MNPRAAESGTRKGASRRRLRRLVFAGLALAASLGGFAPASAGEGEGRSAHPFPMEAQAGAKPSGSLATGATWWPASVAVAGALAVFGAGGYAAAKLAPRGRTGSLKIVERLHLSPKHAIYLVNIHDRSLLVSTGPQGAPALLAELDPAEPEAPIAQRTSAQARDREVRRPTLGTATTIGGGA